MKHLAVLVLLALGCLCATAQQDANQVPADNTHVNKRDRHEASPTGDQQKENPTDRELAKQIRRALTKDKSLSTNAHNVKVIAQGGVVTLKGPVNSEEEKKAVETKAAQIAGSDKVTSQIEVAPK
jgi:osmotically-inducible protein OsmY